MKQRTEQKFKDYKIIDDAGWDLNESFRCSDYELYEYLKKDNIKNRDSNNKIPIDLGCGIELIEPKGRHMFTDEQRSERLKIVTLEVTTYRGIALGAMHYYGRLKFTNPYLCFKDDPECSLIISDIPLLYYNDIQLTKVLREEDFKEFPEAYEYYNIGDNYPGFYDPDDVIKRGEQVFKDHFAIGWVLEINKYL